MEGSSSVSLKVEQIILIMHRGHMRKVVLMMFLIWSWRKSLPFLCCALCSWPDPWWALSRM